MEVRLGRESFFYVTEFPSNYLFASLAEADINASNTEQVRWTGEKEKIA